MNATAAERRARRLDREPETDAALNALEAGVSRVRESVDELGPLVDDLRDLLAAERGEGETDARQ